MKVLLVEDEKPAAKRLERLILSYNDQIIIVGKIDSVKGAIRWLSDHEPPDLIFMDIQLADGLSFEIFEYAEVTSPIIFTTAYDEYALKAFKVNSIDYLLKPIDESELSSAFDKYEKLIAKTSTNNPGFNSIEQITQAMSMLTRQYKNRFIVKIGEHIKAISIDDILFFFSRDRATYCVTTEGKSYLLDPSLQEVAQMLDPQHFFQINRKYIISLKAVNDMVSFSNSRLKIILKHSDDNDVIVSRERVQDFKSWLDQ